MIYFLDQIRSWLSSILIGSLAVALLTLALHWCLCKRPASVRLGVSICGLAAILILGLMPALPFQTSLLKEQPQWLPTPAPVTFDQAHQPIRVEPVTTNPFPDIETSLPIDWLTLAYLCGATLLVFRLGAGLGMAAWLKSHSSKLEGSRPIRLSSKISMPLALGGFRPCILLPLDAQEWSEERVREVYLHEAAHLKNLDWVWQTLANVVSIFHWFNPAVWLINRNLRADMERLADDAVLIQGVSASDYASTLVELARTRQATAPGVLGIPFGRPQGLKGRVASILNPEQPRKLLSKRRLAGLLTVTGLLFGSLSALALGQTKGPGIMADVQVQHPVPGKTTPATPANGFKAKLSDGRILEVLQVTQFDKNGNPESWQPNGNPIPARKAVKIPPVKNKTWVKAMVIRYPLLPHADAFDLSVRGLDDGGEYKYLNFAGGKLLPPKDGYRYGICYFGVPKPTAEFSFTLLIEDAAQQVALSWKPDGSIKTYIPGAQNFKIDEVESSTIGGETFWLQGYEGPLTRISWTNTFGDDWMTIDSFQFKPLPKSGTWDTHSAYTQTQERITYLKRRKAELKGFALVIVPRFTCEVQQVKMRPNL